MYITHRWCIRWIALSILLVFFLLSSCVRVFFRDLHSKLGSSKSGTMFPDPNRFGGLHHFHGFAHDQPHVRPPRRGGERRRRARSNSWSSDEYDSAGFHSDYERPQLGGALNPEMGGQRRLRSPGIGGFGRERALGRGHDMDDDGAHSTRSLAVRIPLRASEPQIHPDEVFLFPQHIIHLTIHIDRHAGQSESFRAAVPPNLTGNEVLASVGLPNHSGHRVLLAPSAGTPREEMPLSSRLNSSARRLRSAPRHLYIQRRRH